MKILNLVLYSENEPAYVGMRDVLRSHTARYPNVRCVFYTYDPEITEPWLLDDDILRIRGHETYVPGILNKTIEAFRITETWDYDLLIRTNISTIVDFSGLVGYCSGPDFKFGGPVGYMNATWTDRKGGIFDGRFSGLQFVRGWCIIFTRATIALMLRNAHFIDTSVIDDVTISDFLTRKIGVVPTDIAFKSVMVTNQYDPTKYVFRNCTYSDRMLDVERMRDIASRIHP
jgi:hypothetical protein